MIEKRGVKRELDVQSPTPIPPQGNANAQSRPQKKRRIVRDQLYTSTRSSTVPFKGSGTPQPAPLQQPTPHGS